jgi:uncharacterized membrane protein YeaQ/YmgE (transglycosylase-associated protein family)
MLEQFVQMGPMWVLAGLGAGWLAETFLSGRGYGLIADMGLGVGAGVLGGSVFLALSTLQPGMFEMFTGGFVLAAGVILAQRLCWPADPIAREREARLHLVDLGRPSLGQEPIPPLPSRPLVRMATTGIYLLRGVPLELQRAARVRAVGEGTTLRQVLLKGLGEYAAGTWTPKADDKLPVALSPGAHATGR